MKLSVLILTYNHSRFVAQALDSVLMQKTNFDYEIVIGDDCSTDTTKDILLDYRQRHKDKIVILFAEQNMGGTRNFVKTLSACKGEYVSILEGDDYWTCPHKLQKQIDFLDRHPDFSMCFTNGSIVDENGQEIKKERLDINRKRNLTQSDIIGGFLPPSNTVVFRRNALKEIPDVYFEIINGDYLLFSLLTEEKGAAYLDENTACYRVQAGGSWSQQSEEYRAKHYVNTMLALLHVYRNKYSSKLLNLLKGGYARISELQKAERERFTENGLWTPQTFMLRSIRDWVQLTAAIPKEALSIDSNPNLDEILLEKWQSLSIVRALYPEYDVHKLNQFPSDKFDLVYSHQVLEHLPKPWIAAKEMVRVLRRGGIGIHTSCAFNPRHGQPNFNDYYRFLPDGLVNLFEGIEVLSKGEWGNREAILYNAGIDDGYGNLGGRRFSETIGKKNDGLYPWHTWIIFKKAN